MFNFEYILGGIIVACFAAYFSYRNIRKSSFLTASQKFRSTVIEAFSDIYSPTAKIKWVKNNSFDIQSILNSRHNTVNAAVIEFSFYLKNKKSFLNDWNIFCGIGINGRETHSYLHYTGRKYDGLPEEDPEEIFHKNLSKLLSYTKT